MRAFAYVAPTFWTRGSGKRLRGNFRAQALALYVMTAPSSTVTGLYYVPATTIAAETGIALADLPEAFSEIAEIAKYDFENEIVWVPEASAHQLGLVLKSGDKRRPIVIRELQSFGDHPFAVEYMDKYGEGYGLDGYPGSFFDGIETVQEGASSPEDGTLHSIPFHSSDLPEQAKPSGKATKPRTVRWKRFPADYVPDETHKKIARNLGIDLNHQLELIKDHEFKEPKTDPAATLRTWLRNADRFGTAKKNTGQNSEFIEIK